MQIKHLTITLFLTMATMSIPLALLSAGDSGREISNEHRIEKKAKNIQRISGINQEDIKPGKKEMKMDGLSLAAHISTTTGIASLFLFPSAGLLLIVGGFIMGVIAWRSKKRYEHRRGRGLIIGPIAIGGVFTMMVTLSLIAYFLTFGGF
ncbi:MAG: hypothetical protein ABIQ02_01635 [Saprospiraceae bacterium]